MRIVRSWEEIWGPEIAGAVHFARIVGDELIVVAADHGAAALARLKFPTVRDRLGAVGTETPLRSLRVVIPPGGGEERTEYRQPPG